MSSDSEFEPEHILEWDKENNIDFTLRQGFKFLLTLTYIEMCKQVNKIVHLHVHRAVARPVVCAAFSRALSPLACHCRWRWLAWAWINCCCFTVEITVKRVFKSQAEQGRERGGWASALKGSRYYRLVEALAAAFNILCLITVSGHHHHRHFCAQLRLLLSLLCSWSLVHHLHLPLHHPPVAFLWRVVVRAVTVRRRTVPSCSASAAATTSSTTPS